MKRFLAWTVLSLALVPACDSTPGPAGEQQNVFPVQQGVSIGVQTRERLLDFSLPVLRNISGRPVRLRSVELVDAPAATQLSGVTAYDIRKTRGRDLVDLGNLPRQCPNVYEPHPLTAVVVAPRTTSYWYVMVTVKLPSSGKFTFGRVRINYISQGRRGWQYQNIGVTATTSPHAPPPSPGGC